MQRTDTPKRRIFAGLVACLLVLGSAVAAEGDREIADEDVTLALESELLLDDAVPSHLIDVSTSQGVVTLSGSVSNLLARERAAEIARTLKGVRSVVNTITVAPLPRTDRQIRIDVKDALLEDPATDLYEVAVEVHDGVVTLTGKVDSYTEKMLCCEVVKGVKGVREVVNDVEYSGETDRLDGEIEAEIERRLLHDAWVDDGLIRWVAARTDATVMPGTPARSRCVRSASRRMPI